MKNRDMIIDWDYYNDGQFYDLKNVKNDILTSENDTSETSDEYMSSDTGDKSETSDEYMSSDASDEHMSSETGKIVSDIHMKINHQKSGDGRPMVSGWFQDTMDRLIVSADLSSPSARMLMVEVMLMEARTMLTEARTTTTDSTSNNYSPLESLRVSFLQDKNIQANIDLDIILRTWPTFIIRSQYQLGHRLPKSKINSSLPKYTNSPDDSSNILDGLSFFNDSSNDKIASSLLKDADRVSCLVNVVDHLSEDDFSTDTDGNGKSLRPYDKLAKSCAVFAMDSSVRQSRIALMEDLLGPITESKRDIANRNDSNLDSSAWLINVVQTDGLRWQFGIAFVLCGAGGNSGSYDNTSRSSISRLLSLLQTERAHKLVAKHVHGDDTDTKIESIESTGISTFAYWPTNLELIGEYQAENDKTTNGDTSLFAGNLASSAGFGRRPASLNIVLKTPVLDVAHGDGDRVMQLLRVWIKGGVV